jgi:hypothetical protein
MTSAINERDGKSPNIKCSYQEKALVAMVVIYPTGNLNLGP